MAAKKLKLNQVIAITNGEKARKQKILTQVYQTLQKADLFAGLKKTYFPLDENGEKLPEETKHLQASVLQSIEDAVKVCESMFNIVAAQDVGNCQATGNVIIDDKVFLSAVPVTHLLFLEKQIVDLTTFIQSFPVLDPSVKWTWDEGALCYKSDPRETVRTKKVYKNHEKAPATDKHPAQVDVYTEDIQIGKYETIHFSGCISLKEKEVLLEKVRKLDKAIKLAREEANSIEVSEQEYGTKILEYIFK